jgi:hypothetical protein
MFFIPVLSSLPIIHLVHTSLPATVNSCQATKLQIQTNNMSDFGDAIANFMVLLVCTVTFVSLPLWRSEKVHKRSKKGKGGQRVAQKTPRVIASKDRKRANSLADSSTLYEGTQSCGSDVTVLSRIGGQDRIKLNSTTCQYISRRTSLYNHLNIEELYHDQNQPSTRPPNRSSIL